MAKFVKLSTLSSNEPLFVNPDKVHIVRSRPVRQGAQPMSTLFFDGLGENNSVDVVGTPFDVISKLAG